MTQLLLCRHLRPRLVLGPGRGLEGADIPLGFGASGGSLANAGSERALWDWALRKAPPGVFMGVLRLNAWLECLQDRLWERKARPQGSAWPKLVFFLLFIFIFYYFFARLQWAMRSADSWGVFLQSPSF